MSLFKRVRRLWCGHWKDFKVIHVYESGLWNYTSAKPLPVGSCLTPSFYMNFSELEKWENCKVYCKDCGMTLITKVYKYQLLPSRWRFPEAWQPHLEALSQKGLTDDEMDVLCYRLKECQ